MVQTAWQIKARRPNEALIPPFERVYDERNRASL